MFSFLTLEDTTHRSVVAYIVAISTMRGIIICESRLQTVALFYQTQTYLN